MFKGLFITGTDTGVGKTYVAERIASVLKNRGVDVGVMKPVETGCRQKSGKLFPEDATRLIRAARVDDELDLVNPYRFREPVAPLVAARTANTKIDSRVILRAFHTQSRKHEFVIVEGAGGIMVPLAARYTYRDLAYDLKLPVLVVARPGLGTINHTLLTVLALRELKVPVAGIVMNHAVREAKNLAIRTNPAVIAQISKIKVLGTVRHGGKDVDWIKEFIMSSPRRKAGR